MSDHKARFTTKCSESFPPTQPQPCSDCPWRRIAPVGWLGPHDVNTWIQIAHSDIAVACHPSIPEDVEVNQFPDWPVGMMQCAGIARYRANVSKRPRTPGVDSHPQDFNVFGFNEFEEHHRG